MTEFTEDQNLTLHHGQRIIFANIGADAATVAPLLKHLWLGNGHRARSGDLRLEKKVAVRLFDVTIEQGDRLAQRYDGQGKIDGNRRLPRPALSTGNGDLQNILLLLKKEAPARG